MTVVPKVTINKNNKYFAYILELNLWHGRLGHINFDALRRLISLDYIPKFQIDPNY